MWDAIATVETREVYRRVLAEAERRGRVSFPYRCDAPREVREMGMTISVLPDGSGWEFVSELRRSTTIPASAPPSPLAWTTSGAAEGALLSVCGWCGKVRHDDAWQEFGDFLAHTGLLAADAFPGISHGICPACHDGLEARFRRR